MVIKKFKTTIAKTDTYQNLSADIFTTDEGLNGDYSLEFEFDLEDFLPSTYHMKQEVVTIEEEKKELPKTKAKSSNNIKSKKRP